MISYYDKYNEPFIIQKCFLSVFNTLSWDGAAVAEYKDKIKVLHVRLGFRKSYVNVLKTF